jgi:hypothetical protein
MVAHPERSKERGDARLFAQSRSPRRTRMTGMAVAVRLLDLPRMHPLLLWEPILPATCLVFRERGIEPPYRFVLAVEEVPGFGTDALDVEIDPGGVSAEWMERCARTFEPSRLIEFAAIAIAGLSLHSAGGHELVDLARRGSAADYLVDAARHHLEIAGRSRRRDLESAWEQKQPRLLERSERGCYPCISEFETCTGRLVFRG